MVPGSTIIFAPIVILVILLTSYFRVPAFARNGCADGIVDPDGKHFSMIARFFATHDRRPEIDVSSAVYKSLKEAFPSSSYINFTNAGIVNYFVLRRAVDGMPPCDIKGRTAQH